MPGFLFHFGGNAICPHAGQVQAITTNSRVFVSGQPVVISSDIHPIAGCVNPPPIASTGPCILVQWLVGATRVMINGQPVILQDSTGLCLNPAQVPQGPPTIIQTQTRVRGV